MYTAIGVANIALFSLNKLRTHHGNNNHNSILFKNDNRKNDASVFLFRVLFFGHALAL